MAYAYPGDGSLDYFPCRYGASRLLFRGPRRDLGAEYVAVLGGTETYGKFVPHPFPDLLEHRIGLPVVNLGCINAGVDAFLNDAAVVEVASRATAAVVQIVGAQNLTNRYYSVHPRRNDRFLGATPLLRALYPGVDFTEFTFTRHLLRALAARDANRFAHLARELRSAWVDRMRALLALLPGETLLLWLADHPPPAPGAPLDLDRDPLLVDAAMIAALRPLVSGLAEVRPNLAGTDLSGMAFAPMEAPAAASLPGPAAHRATADLLADRLTPLL